jgi:tetratricopeptide (TPR) repeat protein
MVKVCLFLLMALWGCSTLPGPTPSEPERRFRDAKEAFESGRYDEARRGFTEFIFRYRGDRRLEEAQWLIGISYERMDDPKRALAEYRALLENFPTTVHRQEALIRIAALRERLETEGETLAGPHRVRFMEWPDSAAGVETDWTETLSAVRSQGFNTVLVRAHRDGGVFFPTQHAPLIQDRMTPLVETAHRLNLQVWVWVGFRRLDWIRPSDHPDWFDRRYDPVSGRLVETQNLDLFEPSVQRYLEFVLLDLLTAGVDGLLFFEDLTRRSTEGFGPAAVSGFNKAYGKDPDPADLFLETRLDGKGHFWVERYGPLFWRWAGWRSGEQLRIVDRLTARLQLRSPLLRTVLILPIESLVSPREALVRFGADLLEAQRTRIGLIGVAVSESGEAGGGLERLRAVLERPDRAVIGIRSLMGSDPDLSGIQGHFVILP